MTTKKSRGMAGTGIILNPKNKRAYYAGMPVFFPAED